MKKALSGNNEDSTIALTAYLQSGSELRLANLYKIGAFDWSGHLLLTDYESPLLWRPQGLFLPATIKRGSVSCKIGLEVAQLNIEYTPPAGFANYEAFVNGYFDNQPMWIWTAYMPTPGDVETFGCTELFGGRVGDIVIDRNVVKITINSFLDVINQKLPNQTIEVTNPMLAYEASPTEDYSFRTVPAAENSL
jgi:hypothetical protein